MNRNMADRLGGGRLAEPAGESCGGWLCPTDADRARTLDMGGRVGRARTIAAAACGIGILATGPWIGWWMLALLAVAVVNLATIERRIARAARPERVIAGSLALIGLLLLAAAAMSGGPRSPALPWIVIPVAVAAARFRAKVVWWGTGVAGVATLALAGAEPGATANDPRTVMATVVLLVAVSAVTTALQSAELQYRGQSVLDPLTGLLNRSGLETRFTEVAEQARQLGRPVCLVVCDLDGFKAVNDTYGHDRGDAVLRDVAYAMRKALRTFELFYRLGGDELVLVLPGIDLHGGVEIAERLCAAVRESRPGGIELTASLGVSAGSAETLQYATLFKAADEALYRAKRQGRDRVASWLPTVVAEQAAAAAA